ncbi:uncharacterized protein LOC123311665 [Coccinella septempunctata]|uniref:uncharacterized protein LOC123311665 n=1 Tax=Coccinella septempunctata TaxID=41139 RepID=UPI001D0704B0|nr:uncharacterized protein LOC123311665 [Coccinella septempunctata]
MDDNMQHNLFRGGLFQHIRSEHDDVTYRDCKSLVNSRKKMASLINRRIFLLRCRTEDIFPKHIVNNIKQIFSLQVETHPYNRLVDRTLHKFRKSLLNIEIKITIWKIQKTENNIQRLNNLLQQRLTDENFRELTHFANRVESSLVNRIRTANSKKLVELEREQKPVIPIDCSDKYVKNYTNLDIPGEVKSVIGLGSKHGIVPCRLPMVDVVKDIESCISSAPITEEEKNLCRVECTGAVNNYLKRHDKVDKFRFPYKKYLRCTNEFIQNNPEIIITESDKGNCTVVMFKEEYIRGVTGLLEDEETYKPLNKDPTKKIQDKVNNKLKEMRTAGLINEIEYRTLIRHNSVIPKLYCLRKTHKDTLSLRPIVSNINAPTYNLGKLMHDILSKVLSTSPYNVKNSIQAKEIIKNIVVPKGYILISLDVVSLFTNISKDLVIRVAHKRWNYIKNFTTLDKATFISLIELCFEGGYFSFNNKFYQQLNGTAMGAPASTSFANLVMNDLFDFVCDRLTFRILLMLLYVDDTLMLIPLEMRQTIFDLFNSYHPSIKFTIEDENENKIPFLDLLITREETNLTTCWYTKTINSNRIINYYSNHSNTQKVNTAISLMYRALSLSDSKFREETTQKVCKI